MALLLRTYLPLLFLGAAAGLLYSLAPRARSVKGRRALQIAWILLLLVGAPLWLFVATTLGWM